MEAREGQLPSSSSSLPSSIPCMTVPTVGARCSSVHPCLAAAASSSASRWARCTARATPSDCGVALLGSGAVGSIAALHSPYSRAVNAVKLVFISMYVYYDYYVNFDWCRKVHSCSCSGTRLACTHARAARLGKIFPRSRRALDTAEKSSREQQALLEYTRTACSMFHGTWCGFDRRSSGRLEF